MIYREDVMLYEPGETSASTTLTMLTLVAHELAHMVGLERERERERERSPMSWRIWSV